MNGTEKQIAWAQDILKNVEFWNARYDDVVAMLHERIAESEKDGRERNVVRQKRALGIVQEANAILNSLNDAPTVIEHRDLITSVGWMAQPKSFYSNQEVISLAERIIQQLQPEQGNS